jgi:puromycin-sensitive aminopeptidase
MPSERLADFFLPYHYQIKLDINLKTLDVTGQTNITGNLQKPAKSVRLHARGLMVKQIDLIYGASHHHELKWKTNSEASELIIDLPEKFPQNASMEIAVTYSLKVTETMEGIYPSYYKIGSKKKLLLSTQLESHHAREAFPCIDEPAAKATFDLSITTSKGQTVLSNTLVKGEQSEGTKKTTLFETTPKMSTYLLAFVIGELGYKEKTTKNGVKFRVYATTNNINRVDFALETGGKVLDFYNKYFGIPYPLKKCDMVAIPEFASGAMENWGLITYRESALLLDSKNSSLFTKQWVALVIAHELAHQWFGNLVTMAWWDDLWLNEGFASWVEFFAVAELFPNWNMWAQFVSEDYHSAITDDALANTHPILQPVNDPREINEIFDNITYRKGSSIIRMLHAYMGKKAFRKGLQNYLKKYQYNNATTNDLWQSLEESSDLPITKFMKAWTKQKGFPLIKWSQKKASILLTQERFILSPHERALSKDKTVWPVPLNLIGTKNHFTLTKRSESWKIKPKKQIKFNIDQTGFYRVHYEASKLKNLNLLLREKALSVPDRAGLVNDVTEMARAGYSKTHEILDFLLVFQDETAPPVWDMISAFTANTWLSLGDEKFYVHFKPYGRELITLQYNRLGWKKKTNESHFDTLLRPTILAMAVKFEDDKAINKAKDLFIKWSNGKSLDPDIRRIVYAASMRHGGISEFNLLHSAHKNEELAEEKRRIAAGITNAIQPEIINKTLNLLNSSEIRQQDLVSWVFGLYANRFSREKVWQWQQNNWEWIEKTYGGGHLISYFIQSLAVFSSEQKTREIKNFYKNKDLTGIKRTLDQTLETIELQAAWRKQDYRSTLSWLQQYK